MLNFWHLVLGVVYSHILLATVFRPREPPEIDGAEPVLAAIWQIRYAIQHTWLFSVSEQQFGKFSISWVDLDHKSPTIREHVPSTRFVTSLDLYRPDMKELALPGQVILGPVCRPLEILDRSRGHVLKSIGSKDHLVRLARFEQMLILSPLNRMKTIPRYLPRAVTAHTALDLCQAETHAREADYGDLYNTQFLGEDQALVVSALYAAVMVFWMVFVLKKGRYITSKESSCALGPGALDKRLDSAHSGIEVEWSTLVIQARLALAYQDDGVESAPDHSVLTPTLLGGDVVVGSTMDGLNASSIILPGSITGSVSLDPVPIPLPVDGDNTEGGGFAVEVSSTDPVNVPVTCDDFGEGGDIAQPEDIVVDTRQREDEIRDIQELVNSEMGKSVLRIRDSGLKAGWNKTRIPKTEDAMLDTKDWLESEETSRHDLDSNYNVPSESDSSSGSSAESSIFVDQDAGTNAGDQSTTSCSTGINGHSAAAEPMEDVPAMGGEINDIKSPTNSSMGEEEGDRLVDSQVDNPRTWTSNEATTHVGRLPLITGYNRPGNFPTSDFGNRTSAHLARSALISDMRCVGFMSYESPPAVSGSDELNSVELHAIGRSYPVLVNQLGLAMGLDGELATLLSEAMETSILETAVVPGHEAILAGMSIPSKPTLGAMGEASVDSARKEKGRLQGQQASDPEQLASSSQPAHSRTYWDRITEMLGWKTKMQNELVGGGQGGKSIQPSADRPGAPSAGARRPGWVDVERGRKDEGRRRRI